MTVSTELSHEEYTGNGVTTDFDFRFRIFEAKHLVVSVADPDGTERILTNGTDYTLRGVGSYRGGKVILKMPLATGWKIGIARDLPAVQETDLRNQGKFFAEVHEDAFDYLTMLIQKSLGYLSLCLRKPSFISDHYDAKGNKISNLGKPVKDGDAVDLSTMKEHISAKDKRSLRVADKDIPALPNTANRANKLLSFDNIGNPVVIVPESGSAADVLTELGKQDGFALIGGLTDNYLRVFDNVAAMVAETSLPLGATVKTRGYYTINDGGEAEYTVTNAAANGITDIALSNGLTASMLTYGDVDIRTVGAVRDTDIGSILVSMQDISRIKTVVIPGYSFDCNKKINVKKNFLFKSGAQIINRTLRDDMFVFETDNLFFKSEKIGGGRIAVDTPLKAWNHNVALVLGKNNLRNLNIDGVRLIPNYSDRSGTALKIRCNNVMDGTNDPARKQNSICWCHFDNLSLEEGEYTLVIEVYEPTDTFEYKVVTNWITACTFKNLVIKGNYGPVLKCIPKTSGKYAYYTQIANLEIDYVQQWTDTSIWALMIDGAGANNITSYIWDYSYYGNQGEYLVDVRGDDGRDNRINTNLLPTEINFNNFSNIYIPKNSSQEQNAIGLRRLCRIFKNNGFFILNRSYLKPMGVHGIEVDSNDDYSLKLSYTPGVSQAWQPYVMTQALNQANGFKYSLIPWYNQSPSSSGVARFYIVNNTTQSLIKPKDLPDGVEFSIEITCTN
ncbi:hypothetical protein ISO78_06885 [Morganella morganii subsp. morganii]|uniref:hypothetical protein n=1 Tax=Morganella morganii TaxID=582 RepID=UPI001BDAA3B6|nr:hypothetical protein [Morganella morganii]MBT0355964.1 hypothetical protein [Morganella morganii subsp. morganii]